MFFFNVGLHTLMGDYILFYCVTTVPWKLFLLVCYYLCMHVSIYGARGRRDKQSYHYVHETRDGDVISFIAVDACPDPGPRRPFNFFGVLSQVNQQYR